MKVVFTDRARKEFEKFGFNSLLKRLTSQEPVEEKKEKAKKPAAEQMELL